MENDLSHILFSKLFWGDRKGWWSLGLHLCFFQLQYEDSDWTKIKRTEQFVIVYCFCGDGTFFSILLLCTEIWCACCSLLSLTEILFCSSNSNRIHDIDQAYNWPKPWQHHWLGSQVTGLSTLLVWSYIMLLVRQMQGCEWFLWATWLENMYGIRTLTGSS